MSNYMLELRKLIGTRRVILPCVRAIILDSTGAILLQRRTDYPIWCLPAGGVELGETALEAVIREVAEETALSVLRAEPMAFYSGSGQRFEYPNGDQIECFAMAFIIRDWTGQPEADGIEGSELRFFHPDQLPEDMVTYHRQTIDDFKKYDGTFKAR